MEIWKTCVDFDEYEVSSFGNVRRKEGIWREGKQNLKPCINRYGYFHVILHFHNGEKRKQTTQLVHRLVVKAFLSKVEGKDQVDHIDRCKTNNRLENLRYASRSENQMNKNSKGYSKYQRKDGSIVYVVQLKIEGKSKHLGCFKDEKEAQERVKEVRKIYRSGIRLVD